MIKIKQTAQRLQYESPANELIEFFTDVLANSNGMTMDDMTDVNGTWDE